MKKNDLAELGNRSTPLEDPIAFLLPRLQTSLANDDIIISESSASSIADSVTRFLTQLHQEESEGNDKSDLPSPIFLTSGKFPVSRKIFDSCLVTVTNKSVALICFVDED